MKQLVNDELVVIKPANPDKAIKDLHDDDVQWVVNDLAELGVKIGNKTFFLYKGRSYQGGGSFRPVGKREFGECVYPIQSPKLHSGYRGYHGEPDEMWEDK